MARKKPHIYLADDDGYDLTPMIDIVFLLLIYFMVTTALIKEEADMGIKLPAQVPPTNEPDLPDEQIIEIMASGEVLLNGAPMDHFESRDMPTLTYKLQRLKAANDNSGLKTSVTILADQDSLHQRSIDVLNACGAAKIKYVMFASD